MYRCRSIHCHVHCFSSSAKAKPNSQNIAQAGWLSVGLAGFQGSTTGSLEDTLLYVVICPLMAHERHASKLRKHLTATKQLFIFWSQCIALCMCTPYAYITASSQVVLVRRITLPDPGAQRCEDRHRSCQRHANGTCAPARAE